MNHQLTAKLFRIFISFISCKLLFFINTSMAATFDASKDITMDTASGEWVLIKTIPLRASLPNANSILTYCAGLGDEGSHYAACGSFRTGNGRVSGADTFITSEFHQPQGQQLEGADGSKMDVKAEFRNIGMYFTVMHINQHNEQADSRSYVRALSNSYSDTTGAINWRDSKLTRFRDGRCAGYALCNKSEITTALIPYSGGTLLFPTTGNGGLDLYVRVPNDIKSGVYSGEVTLGTLTTKVQFGSLGTPSATASIKGRFRVTVPQRCKMTFPEAVSFDATNSGTPSTTMPLQNKKVTFTSECSGLNESNVEVELFLAIDDFDTAIGAAMLDNEKTLGVKASLAPITNCSSM